MFEGNQKTVFVLDHTPYFSISSEDYISLEYLKGKPTILDPTTPAGQVSIMQFSKSLWTCSVESSVEYCRIVWDLFPRGKLVRFIVSDSAAHIVNTWQVFTQNLTHVLNAMAMVGAPVQSTPQSSDYSVIHGLRAAIEALSDLTEEQAEAKVAGVNQLPNEGRVICITSARDNTSMKSLEDIFHSALLQQNTLAATRNDLLAIDHCHLVILNVVPLNLESMVTNRGMLDITSLLATEIHTVSALNISNKLTHLILSHYDLASTTVTNIPMKEEQNANSSANYDVEILHARSAHTIICGNEALLPTSIKDGAEYETVTLKWCTPRGCGSADLQPCLSQNRVTPVDVTSRPSSCLINFLLNGRAVLLEMPRKTGGKTTSHLLSARGGEIFIHSLQITRTCLEELPSITDGPGGRVQDYRLQDFTNLIKSHRFVPLKVTNKTEDVLLRARNRLQRRTKYFPLTLSTSMIFNLQKNFNWLPYFLHKIIKEDMDMSDEAQCQNHIYELYAAQTRGETLPLTNTNTARIKSAKKTEQYRLLYAELEMLIRSYATTPFHKMLMENVHNLRLTCGEVPIKSSENNLMLRNLMESPLSPEKADSSTSNNSITKSTNKKRTSSHSGSRSLLDIFSSVERNQGAKRSDFSGRMVTPIGQTSKLYSDFGAKESLASGGNTTASFNILDDTIFP